MTVPLGFELLWAPRHPPLPKRLHVPLFLMAPAFGGLLLLVAPAVGGPLLLVAPALGGPLLLVAPAFGGSLLLVGPCSWWAPRLKPSQPYR